MAAIDDEFGLMLDDCHAAFGNSTSITIVTPGTMDTATGIRPSPGTPLTVSAMREPRRMTPGGPGIPGTVEVVYRVKVSALATCKRGAKVTEGSQTLYVHAVGKEVNDLEWVLTCQSTKPTPT